ncbi:MazG nucleotide pyrophosphohydrolase domain-containing protein [Streptomyces sp. NPDC060028]|uniref:MazG nucleotide pyrophosphohydrolase domain-containing protein n=1 Tax=Streptomyces sp. NPDC060028 TaxID=3347041 RepID=UPI0036C93B67
MNQEPAESTAERVRAFHRAFGLDCPAVPTPPSPALARHRQDLLHEEVAELAEATAEGELAHIAHELADVVYIAYGTAAAYGIDLDAVIAEVHRANMSKLGPGGRPAFRADGKVLKGDAYVPPDVASVLRGS